MPTFNELPKQIILNIISFLNYRAIAALDRVNRRTHEFVNDANCYITAPCGLGIHRKETRTYAYVKNILDLRNQKEQKLAALNNNKSNNHSRDELLFGLTIFVATGLFMTSFKVYDQSSVTKACAGGSAILIGGEIALSMFCRNFDFKQEINEKKKEQLKMELLSMDTPNPR